MKATDFRIGNLYKPTDGSQNGYLSVSADDIDAWSHGSIYGKPIKLSEGWMDRLGFKQKTPKNGVLKSWHLDGITVELSNSGNFYYCGNPIMLHDLQNVYYFYRNRKKELSF